MDPGRADRGRGPEDDADKKASLGPRPPTTLIG